MFWKSQKRKSIFVDYASATPLDVSVQKIMNIYMKKYFHNPNALYQPATELRNDIENARQSIAETLGARSQEIYFVDGATEANNLALYGTISYFRKYHPDIVPHVVSSKIEHASILEPLKHMESEGIIELTLLNVDGVGLISEKEFKAALQPNTVLVSIGYVNGEIGTIQDIRQCAKIIRHHRKKYASEYPYFHTDAVQAINYVDLINVLKLGVDMLTLNAAKIYGPKKTATLFIRSGAHVHPRIIGGNQESGIRSGTEDVVGIIGLSQACIEARKIQPVECIRMSELQVYARGLFDTLPGVVYNSHTDGIPNIINISFPNISHEEIVLRLDARNIYASVKSACKAGEDGDSHVILALRDSQGAGLPTGSLRFSFGRATTKKDIQRIYNELLDIITGMNDTYKKYYQG